MEHGFLKEMGILFGLAIIAVTLFRRLRFPSIIGFLVAGILAGPHSLALIRNIHQVEQIAEIPCMIFQNLIVRAGYHLLQHSIISFHRIAGNIVISFKTG